MQSSRNFCLNSVKDIADLVDYSVEKVADQNWSNPKYDWIQNGAQFKEQIEAKQMTNEISQIENEPEYDETQRI